MKDSTLQTFFAKKMFWKYMLTLILFTIESWRVFVSYTEWVLMYFLIFFIDYRIPPILTSLTTRNGLRKRSMKCWRSKPVLVDDSVVKIVKVSSLPFSVFLVLNCIWQLKNCRLCPLCFSLVLHVYTCTYCIHSYPYPSHNFNFFADLFCVPVSAYFHNAVVICEW